MTSPEVMILWQNHHTAAIYLLVSFSENLINSVWLFLCGIVIPFANFCGNIPSKHGLRTPGEEIAFTARLKIHFHSRIFRYGRTIFCLPHQPKFSDFFDLCLRWVSVVRGSQRAYFNFLVLYRDSFLDGTR